MRKAKVHQPLYSAAHLDLAAALPKLLLFYLTYIMMLFINPEKLQIKTTKSMPSSYA